jgi:hypothetical protein
VRAAAGHRVRSGILDVLVERIANSVGSSVVGVAVVATGGGGNLLAESPLAASRSIDTAMCERYADPRSGGICRRGAVVAAPVCLGGVTVG